MTRDRLLIKDVSSGIPATWHRNTLSIFGTSNDSTSASSAPSQLVHPDGSFNVGLAVDSVQLDHRGARIPDHDNGSDEQQTLMVYASADEGSKHDVVRHHPVMITVLLFYLLLTLWLGPLAMKAPEATYRTTILVSICCASLLDLFLVVGVLWRFGFFDTMNLNTTMLSFLILVLLLHTESVVALCLVGAHCITVLATRYSLWKCTSRLFLVYRF
ncbi:chromosome condensation regulator RCC1 protein, putative [Babesia ovis]|uniref:Chromosome condensation regulator RCC1 protein, putative n=1 Tax=Babesia ovis TaxID=5869 RepID=A0A9W5WW77_BABOV|nr:chromosome condensation regulator RCC1 protein, putative [Babesia ovis]